MFKKIKEFITTKPDSPEAYKKQSIAVLVIFAVVAITILIFSSPF